MSLPERTQSHTVIEKKPRIPVTQVVFESAARGIDYVAERVADRYLRFRTSYRGSHFPQTRLTKAEAWYVGSENRRDPEKKKALQVSIRNGITEATIQESWRRRMGLTDPLLRKLADLATDSTTRACLLEQNEDLRQRYDRWDHSAPSFGFATAMEKGVYSLLPYATDLAVLGGAWSAALAAGQMDVVTSATAYEIANHLGRFEGEAKVTIGQWFEPYQQALIEGSDEIVNINMDSLVQRIVTGEKSNTLAINQQKKFVSAIAGIEAAQVAINLADGSPARLALQTVIPGLLGAALYYKNRRENDGEDVSSYRIQQREYNTMLDAIKRVRVTVADIFKLQEKRDYLVDAVKRMLMKSERRQKLLTSIIPGGGFLLSRISSQTLSDAQGVAFNAGVGVLSSVIIAAEAGAMHDSVMWRREIDVGQDAQDTLWKLCSRLEESPYHVTTYQERKTVFDRFRNEGERVFTTVEEAHQHLAGASLVVGKAEMEVGDIIFGMDPDTQFDPGIHVFQGKKGTGKTTVAGVLTGILGAYEKLHVSFQKEGEKKIDVRTIAPEVLEQLVRYCPIGNSIASRQTLAERIKPFVFDHWGNNLFQEMLARHPKDDRVTQRLFESYSQKEIDEAIQFLLTSESDEKGPKHALFAEWVASPLPATNDTREAAIQKLLLTDTFRRYIATALEEVENENDAVAWLRKVSRETTSEGQANLVELRFALSSKKPLVLFLDEPTESIDRGIYSPGETEHLVEGKSALMKSIDMITDYQQWSPHTITAMATHDNELKEEMRKRSLNQRRLVRNLLTLSTGTVGDKKRSRWEIEPLGHRPIATRYEAERALQGPLTIKSKVYGRNALSDSLIFPAGQIHFINGPIDAAQDLAKLLTGKTKELSGIDKGGVPYDAIDPTLKSELFFYIGKKGNMVDTRVGEQVVNLIQERRINFFKTFGSSTILSTAASLPNDTNFALEKERLAFIAKYNPIDLLFALHNRSISLETLQQWISKPVSNIKDISNESFQKDTMLLEFLYGINDLFPQIVTVKDAANFLTRAPTDTEQQRIALYLTLLKDPQVIVIDRSFEGFESSETDLIVGAVQKAVKHNPSLVPIIVNARDAKERINQEFIGTAIQGRNDGERVVWSQ